MASEVGKSPKTVLRTALPLQLNSTLWPPSVVALVAGIAGRTLRYYILLGIDDKAAAELINSIRRSIYGMSHSYMATRINQAQSTL